MPRPERLNGPEPAHPGDIDRINRVFSEAFTDRYQRDGMSGVRVPMLNPDVWRFAIATAGSGALVWRDASDEIVAFNMVHHSGSEGWMGPLAVRPGRQGQGIGGLIVRTGVARLEAAGARVIGLETMPRTVDNIGFYSRLGFRPQHLTVSMTQELDAPPPEHAALLSEGDAPGGIRACRHLLEQLAPGLDFGREIELTLAQQLGDVTLLSDRGELSGFALWHSAPLAEGRPPDEVRVLKLAARNLDGFSRLLAALAPSAWQAGGRRVAVRCQTAYRGAYGALLAAGYRVHWTDLRMTLDGREEASPAGEGIVFSNWEI